MDQNVDILIIGGGITGLSLASFLKTSNYLILEKENELGGYCKTKITNDFIWDYSGHFFHFNNPAIKNYLIENIECEITTVKKICYIYYYKQYIDFPFQNNIHQLEESEYLNCLEDLKNKNNHTGNSFVDYIKNQLGDAICNKFIIPYNQKLYACDLNELDINAMGRFFPKPLNYNELIDKNKEKQKSYNDTFIYPKLGSYEFIKSILKRVETGNISLSTTIIDVNLEEKKVITNNGTINFKRLVNTIPFNHFLKTTGVESNQFSWNKVIVFNIGFDSRTDITANWIYYPGDEIFYRVGFYNNIFKTEKMNLYVEIGMKYSEEYDENDLFKKVLADLAKVGIIKNHKIIDYQVLCMNPAYVHITKESKVTYNKWCNKNNPLNIFSIGRYGSWTYCSIEDNILQAQELAQHLNKKQL